MSSSGVIDIRDGVFGPHSALRSEMGEFDERTTDPTAPEVGDMWVREDVTVESNHRAQLRIQGQGGVLKVPIFDSSVESNLGSDVYVGKRYVFSDGSVGLRLHTDQDGAKGSPRLVTSSGTELEAHDSVALTTIPDSGDLQSRYNVRELSASNDDTISTLPDLSDNSFDLTAGSSPVYKESVINGNPVLRFDGVDDHLDVSWSNISQPFTVFAVFQMQTFDTSSAEAIFGTATSSNRGHLFVQPSSDNWSLFGGNSVNAGSPDTNAHILTAFYDGANSYFRIDGTQITSGDAGSNQSDGLTVGAQDGGDFFSNVDLGEMLVYPQDKTAIQTDVESYLSDGWGITI